MSADVFFGPISQGVYSGGTADANLTICAVVNNSAL